MLKIKIIGPRNLIKNNIVVTYGELKKGKKIDSHINKGVEFNYNNEYNIEGKAELKLNGQSYFMKAGDSSAFNARLEHSVTALEKLKFLASTWKMRISLHKVGPWPEIAEQTRQQLIVLGLGYKN